MLLSLSLSRSRMPARVFAALLGLVLLAGLLPPAITRAAVLPTIVLSSATDFGQSDEDGITSDSTPIFFGDRALGTAITVYVGGTDENNPGTATAAVDSNLTSTTWTATIPGGTPLSEGTQKIFACPDTGIPCSDALTITIDATAPGEPVLTLNTTVGASADFAFTTPADPISGGVASGIWQLRCLLDGTSSDCTAGTKSYTSLPDGPHLFRVFAQDVAGNASEYTDYAWTSDATSPIVSSITRADANPTNASAVDFTVTFSEAVTGVATTNFALTTTGVTGTSIDSVSGSGTTWTVTVDTGSGSGTIRLDQTSAGTVEDVPGNPLTGTHNGDETYAIDRTAPTVASINRADPSPTSATTVQFTVTLNESVTGVTAGAFSVTNTGTAAGTVGTVTGSGTTWTVTVTGVAGTGTLRLDLVTTTGIVDGAGNALGSGFATGQTYAVAPGVPNASTPTARIASGTAPTGSVVATTITLGATNTSGGLSLVELEKSTNGGTTWTPVTLPTPTSLSVTVNLPSGVAHKFRARVTDGLGFMSAWSNILTVTPTLSQESRFTYARTWTYSNSSSASGGRTRVSSVANASATLTFTGRDLALVMPRGPTRGTFKVYVDGTYIRSINLYSAIGRSRQVVYSKTWGSAGAHTIRIVVTHWPASRPRVDLDALATLK